jgi:hypothetical protein
VVLVLFPAIAIACLVLRMNAFRLYATAWGILAGMGHTRVEVRRPAYKVLVNIE